MKLSLGYQVFCAVLLGIFVGLFFGPLCSALIPVATVFTMLVQMVVLPYICLSLIHGLGSISPVMGKRLLVCGLPFLLALWAIVLMLLFLLDQLIPHSQATIVTPTFANNNASLSEQLLKFLVPENPIYDLANNIVPAVAVFGLIVGIALMHIAKKEVLCTLLERINNVIEKILVWLAIISPIGVFTHIAIAVGTVRFEDLYKLEFYVLCYISLSLFITFWILPLFISCLTPLTYRDVLKAFRAVCLLPFLTALSSLSIPFLNDFLLKLSKKHPSRAKFHENAQTVLPIAYSFGQIGNCVVLFFIFFLAFYYRQPLEGSEKTLLSFLSLPMSVGSSSNSVSAISFLINQFKFPPEALELFMETSSITANFQVLMSVSSVVTIIILTIYGYYGLLQIRWKELILRMGCTLVVFAFLVFSVKSVVQIGDKYEDLYLNLKISEVIPNPVKAKFLQPGETGTPRDNSYSELEQILGSGVLKVGYYTFDIPYCYWNNAKEIAGYDMAYAYQIARDLDCSIEFVRYDPDRIGEELESGTYDIGMAAILMTEERLKSMNFSHHYSEQNVVFIVPAAKKKPFLNLDALTENPKLKIGSIGAYSSFAEKHFPHAQIVRSSSIDIAKMRSGEIDCWIWSRDPAVVWCIANPDFIVVDYEGLIGKTYFAYAIRDNSFKFASYLNNSFLLKELSGFQKEMYNYWIKGESVRPKKPRWSILQYLRSNNEND